MISIQSFIVYWLIINLAGFILMGYDKFKAKNNEWRINEKTFFVLAFLLGAPGIYLGMNKFKHKTKHTSFNIGIPLLFILNIAIIYVLIYFKILA